jgi:hypothetical protein
MRIWARLCLVVAALLFVLFLVGHSDFCQRLLIGQPSADHWQRDDQYMGAALAHVVYCLVPSVLLAIVGTALFIIDRKRRSAGPNR